MNLFPIVSANPIYVPQKQFVDRFGNANAYVAMNPSLYIDQEGQITLLVRRVNYRKFQDKQFILYEPKSISSYVVLKGSMLDTNIPNTMTCDELKSIWSADQPSYTTYWLGMEDIRFCCNPTTLLLTVPEKNPSGQPCIFQGLLQGSTVKSIIRCEPSRIEKNWMPYMESDGSTKVIYSVVPFQIKTIHTDETTTIALSEELTQTLEGYHGSTNGICYKDTWRLFLIHINKERTYHKWLLYNPETKTVRASKEFVFFQYSSIEFPCSLCEYKDTLYVSLGINDDCAQILTLKKSDVDTWLQETTS